MREFFKRFIKPADIIIAAAVLFAAAAAALFLFFAPRAGTADVYLDGKLVATLSLSENKTLNVTETLVVTVKDGAVAVTESGCPDKICVNTGFVSGKGRTIVCVPERVAVVLSGEGVADVVA